MFKHTCCLGPILHSEKCYVTKDGFVTTTCSWSELPAEKKDELLEMLVGHLNITERALWVAAGRVPGLCQSQNESYEELLVEGRKCRKGRPARKPFCPTAPIG